MRGSRAIGGGRACAAALLMVLALPAQAADEWRPPQRIEGRLRYGIRGGGATHEGIVNALIIMPVAMAAGMKAVSASVRLFQEVAAAGGVSLPDTFGNKEVVDWVNSSADVEVPTAPVDTRYDAVVDFVLQRGSDGAYHLERGTVRYALSSTTRFSGEGAEAYDDVSAAGTEQLDPARSSIVLRFELEASPPVYEINASIDHDTDPRGESFLDLGGGVLPLDFRVERKGPAMTMHLPKKLAPLLGGMTEIESNADTSHGFAYVGRHTFTPPKPGWPLTLVADPETWPNAFTGQDTAMLSLGIKPSDARLEILGPDCTCVNLDEVGSATVTYTARAAEEGGTFSEFAVQSEGGGPLCFLGVCSGEAEIVSNRGGDAPELVLRAKGGTRAATLRITYEMDGAAEVAERKIGFCDFRRPELDREDASFDGSARLRNRLRMEVRQGGEPVEDGFQWDADPIAGSELETKPEDPSGPELELTYTGLPQSNESFGEKRVLVKWQGGGCRVDAERTFRAFYAPKAKGPDGQTPSWFHYWKQTEAAGGQGDILVYRAQIPGQSGGLAAARYEPVSDLILISELIVGSGDCTRGSTGNTGIDCFGEAVRHERRHRADNVQWWGVRERRSYLIVNDPDLDLAPTTVELVRPGCIPVSQRSCDYPGRPFADVGDAEWDTYQTGWGWAQGSADAEDWSCGGKQWPKGEPCPG